MIIIRWNKGQVHDHHCRLQTTNWRWSIMRCCLHYQHYSWKNRWIRNRNLLSYAIQMWQCFWIRYNTFSNIIDLFSKSEYNSVLSSFGVAFDFMKLKDLPLRLAFHAFSTGKTTRSVSLIIIGVSLSSLSFISPFHFLLYLIDYHQILNTTWLFPSFFPTSALETNRANEGYKFTINFALAPSQWVHDTS